MSYEQFSIHDLNDVGQMGCIYWSRFSIQHKAWGNQVNCECFRLYDNSRHSTFKYFEVVSYFTCISVLMLHVYLSVSFFPALVFSRASRDQGSLCMSWWKMTLVTSVCISLLTTSHMDCWKTPSMSSEPYRWPAYACSTTHPKYRKIYSIDHAKATT